MAALAFLLALVRSGIAEPPRAAGSNTGDGSTPFTGLAQAPEANLFVGAATTLIPIDVPPGRKNLTPKLALAYSSSGGPSPYGYGWDLPLGKVQRCGKHGVLSCGDPKYRNEFVLVLPGASVECTLDASNRCSPAVEESFLRIEYQPSDNHWDVWDKSGLRYRFGDTDAARTGSGTSQLFTEGSFCRYTFSWALTSIQDPNGNRLDISYQNVEGVLYPDRIQYGGNVSTGLGHLFEVSFVWSDADGFSRPAGDQIINGIGGFRAKLTKLLSRIRVRYISQDRLVRWYKLQYEFQTSAPDRIGRQSFLSAVTLFDRNNNALSRADQLPAQTTFLYRQNETVTGSGFAPEIHSGAGPAGVGRLQYPGSMDPIGEYRESLREVLDMNGDGIPDVVDTQDCPNNGRNWKVFLGRRGGQGFDSVALTWHSPDPTYGCGIRWVSVSSSGPASATWYDTLDINGDGIPDWIDSVSRAAQQQWKVYLGEAKAADHGWRFSPTATYWNAPRQYLRETRKDTNPPTFIGYPHASIDVQDVIDMNGDGLPDLVDALSEKVWFNTGGGFETGDGAAFPFAYDRLRLTTETGTEIIGVYDINGDGLPDQIVVPVEAWVVYLNRGETLYDWGGGAECGHHGIRDVVSNTNRVDVTRDFFDINGDGLPDIVDACGWSQTNKKWKVYLNRGGGNFSPTPYLWDSPSPVIRDRNDGDGADAGNKTYADTLDVDGDGLVDFVYFAALDVDGGDDIIDFGNFSGAPSSVHVHHNAGGAWCPSSDGTHCGIASTVIANPDGMRPDLLERMENGVGGTTHLEYRPSTQWDNTNGIDDVPHLPFVLWTLTHIEQDDGLCDDQGGNCISPGSHTLSTDLTYAYGKFNSDGREFRGFGTVQQLDVENNVRTTFFHQDAVRKGKVSEARFRPAGDPNSTPLLVKTTNTWACVNPSTQAVLSCADVLTPPARRWGRLKQSDRYDYNADATVKHSFTQNVAFDAYGNVTHSVRGGDATDSVHTYATYAARDVPHVDYIVDKPMRSWVVDSADKLEEKWFFYDGQPSGQLLKGNVTKVESWLDQSTDQPPPCSQSGTQRCVATTMTYDSYGNITTVADAQQHTTTTLYDAATQIYPYTVRNALDQVVAAAYEPGCGKLLWQTVTYALGGDPTAQPRTQSAYDTFCRLTAGAPPDEAITSPHWRYSYYLGAPPRPATNNPAQATDVWIREAEPHAPSGTVSRDALFDALGRHLQTQRDAVVDGAQTVIADGSVAFDARGNASQRFAPFAMVRQPNPDYSSMAYVAPPTGTSATSFAYDALNRVYRVTNADGKMRTSDYSLTWQTTTMDECSNAGTCPGGKVVETRDAFGRVTLKQVFDGANLETRTNFSYDGMDRVIQTQLGTPTAWKATTTNTYDSLGRRTKVLDPDSGSGTNRGVWTYGYDRLGNLVHTEQPTGEVVDLRYDALNRLAAKTYPNHQVAPAVVYSYDGNGYDGGRCAATASAATALGRLTHVQDLSGDTTMTYDIRGRTRCVRTGVKDGVDSGYSVTPVIYSETGYSYDAADHVRTIRYIDGEVVTYDYDEVGQVQSLTGSDEHGQPVAYLSDLTYDVFGRPRQVTHGNQVADTFSYGGPGNNFRLEQLFSGAPNAQPLQALAYDHYQANGLLAHVNDTGPGGTLRNTATFGYDGVGRLTTVSDNPAMNATYGYGDHLGNITVKGGVGLTYNGTRPHQLADAAALGGTVTYDNNGNFTAKTGQSYTYDPENRMKGVWFGPLHLDFLTDYAGRRVLSQDSAGPRTRSYLDLAQVTDTVLTKYYFAAGMRLASQRFLAPKCLLNPFSFGACPPATAALAPAVQVAGDPRGQRLLLVVALRPDVRVGVAAGVLVGALVLLVIPGRRKAMVGIVVRRGHVVLLIVLFGFYSLPLPVLLRPAWAGGGGGGGGGSPPQPTPMPTPTPVGGVASFGVKHYHHDHLGSTQAITNADGSVFVHIRYKAYGEVRGYYDATGQPLPEPGDYRFQFTDYEREPTAGLYYAGARFYDPQLGMFLTHDPVPSYASPYSYVGGNPTNVTDPNGECPICVVIIVGVIVGALASGIQAAVNGASPVQALKAATIGGAIGGASAGVGFGVLSLSAAYLGPTVTYAIELAAEGAGTYSTVESFRSGQYATGAIGAVFVAFGAYELGQGPDAFAQDFSAQGRNGGDARGLDVSDSRTGDLMEFQDGPHAGAISKVDPPFGHSGVVSEGHHADDLGEFQAGTSDLGGQRVAKLGDPTLSGRSNVALYRPRVEPSRAGIFKWLDTFANGGGPGRYLGLSREGHLLGNVCSGTCNSIELAGGVNTGFSPGSFVTPSQLSRSPAFVRVGVIPYIP